MAKKTFVPNFSLMTTTNSQDFKEIQEIDVHHLVTLVVDFPTGTETFILSCHVKGSSPTICNTTDLRQRIFL